MSNDLCSKKIIMLTRPHGQAYGMIELVRKLGWPAYNEPIVEIEPISGPVGWSSNLAAIAVTSPNGARCLESIAGLARTMPVFAVGSATADELREKGPRCFRAINGCNLGCPGIATLVAELAVITRLTMWVAEFRRPAPCQGSSVSVLIIRAWPFMKPRLLVEAV